MRPSLMNRRSPERTVESLYRDYAADVYRYALAVLGSSADAEDVTQATFLNAFRAIERGERPRHPGAWLRVIANNLCLQQFRQLSRRPQQVELDEEAGELVADDQAPTLEDLIRGLKQVPFNQRAALVMREFEGRPVAEIAEILGVSRAAVETLLFRARRSLREQLEESLTCTEAERAISRQLDGLLPRGERGPLRAHLRECKDCASHARRLRAQRSSMRSLAVVPLPAALAWAHVGGGATGGAAGAAAGGAGAPIGVSLATKLAAAALATGAIGGLGYVGVTQHLFDAAPARTHAAPRTHSGKHRITSHRGAGTRGRARHVRHARVHHAPAISVVAPPTAVPVAPPTAVPVAPAPAIASPRPRPHAPQHAHKSPPAAPKHHTKAQHPAGSPKRPAPPRNVHKPKPHKPVPSSPSIPPGHDKPAHVNPGKGPPATR
jgi:RNA polymerase sigma factor (sigma-70 family)